jgi:hypothetical protein
MLILISGCKGGDDIVNRCVQFTTVKLNLVVLIKPGTGLLNV